MLSPRIRVALVTIILAGCGGGGPSGQPAQNPESQSDPSAQDKGQMQSPTAAALLRELNTWEAEVEISQRQDPSMGLGDSVIRVEGEPVWPPAGEQCLPLVQCCEQLAGRDPIYGLLCQMSVAKDGNCDRGLQKVATIVVEQQVALPEPCRPQH